MSFTEDKNAEEGAALRGVQRVAWSARISGVLGSAPWRGVVRMGVGAALAGFVTACTGPGPLQGPGEAGSAPPGVSGGLDIGGDPTPASLASRPLPPPGPVRSMQQVRLQAAQRMVLANAGHTYVGAPPEVLLAIPVLEIELNADGSVRRVSVMRKPTQAFDTTQLAINAVYRGAPYGDVSRLPRPWKFVETFLFDDDRRFKPRSLND